MKSKKICGRKRSKFLVSVLCLTLILSTASGALAAQKGDSGQATSKKIAGSELIQTREFDENTEFPVAAGPSTIVDKKIRSTTYKVVTGWEPVGDQPPGGIIFRTGGSIYSCYGAGRNKSISVAAQLTSGRLMVTFPLGTAKVSSSGMCVNTIFPPSKRAAKVIAKHYLTVTEKAEDYRYKTTKITDNGKTTTTTYKWVTVRNWVAKVIESRPKYGQKYM